MDIRERIQNFTNAKVNCNVPMKKYSAFKTGGNADFYITVSSVNDLRTVLELLKENKTAHKVVGNCTNVLISDFGYNGAIISLKGLNQIRVKGDEITAFSGANLNDIIKYAVNNNLCGLERLISIPATIGGAVKMNASAFNLSIADVIKEVTVYSDGKLNTFMNKECKFGYRKSRFNGKEIIISACFKLKKSTDRDFGIKETEKYRKERKIHQPIGRTCGSTFKNPKGYFAGDLIERANLKGERIGGAIVSKKHANFIMTEDGATSQDVYNLIRKIKLTVKQKFNVELQEEIEYIGKF